MTIIPLPNKNPQVRIDRHRKLVERLEKLLNQAKAGEINAIAYVVLDDDNSAGSGWIGGCRKLREQAAVLFRRLDDACGRNRL